LKRQAIPPAEYFMDSIRSNCTILVIATRQVKENMNNVTATTGKEQYKTIVKSETNIHIADEPAALGVKDLGFSPQELLASSLASCTSITLRMYTDHKKWEVGEIKVTVSYEKDEETNVTTLEREVYISGELDEKQRKRILSVANACPIHKTLINTIEIN